MNTHDVKKPEKRMSNIGDTIKDLNDTLSQQMVIFTNHQNMHFDWLQSVKFQLDVYSDKSISLQDSRSAPEIDNEQKKQQNEVLAAKQSQITTNSRIQFPDAPATPPRSIMRCCTSPSLLKPRVRFVDDTSMLDSMSVSETDYSDYDEDECEIPFSTSGAYSELTQSATSFHAQWQEMLEMKKAQTVTSDAPFKFSFEERPPAPIEYEITDDEDMEWGSDDEIYEKNPFEIHGKVIPMWARQDRLMKTLREQKDAGLNGDDVFADTLKTCTLTRIFGAPPRRISTENDPNLTNQAQPHRKRAGAVGRL